jgi:uncharacterized membrane protein YfcA
VRYAVVSAVALLVAALTLFSGFGLGTLLLPAFAVFFPVAVAVAATAVVHLANNLFKLMLVGRHADPGVVVRFAVPAAAGAMFGAWLLTRFADLPPLATYELGGQRHEITLVKLTVAVLMIVFALFELVPGLQSVHFDRRWLEVGGLLSGFFGGLSGHQGALRAAFLVNTGLDREAFIGTSVVCAVVVDLARLLVYGVGFDQSKVLLDGEVGRLVGVATLAAFVGSYAGSRLVGTVTMRSVQLTVGAMLLVVALGLGAGLV